MCWIFFSYKKERLIKIELWPYDLVQSGQKSKLAQLFSIDVLGEESVKCTRENVGK